MDAITVPALLSGGMSVLASVAVFLFLRLEKSKNDYITDLKAEHSKRIEDKDRATAALLAQNDRLHSSLERMADIVESHQTGMRTPGS